MKTIRIPKLLTALALVAGGASAANANELFNPNLDLIAISTQNNPTPVGWNVDANKVISGANFDGCSSEPWCNVIDSGGYGLFFKPFQGSVGDEVTVDFYQDNPATPGTKFTLSGYAAGEANFCAFFTTNSPLPKSQFFVAFLDAGGNGIITNSYDLVSNFLPSSGPGSMSLFTTPQYTAPAGTVTVRAGARMANAYSTAGAQSFFVDAFDLESVAPPGSPVITNQPAQVTVSAGATAVFTVGVSNSAGCTYQWQLYNTNLVNGGNVSGATGQTLTITGVSTNYVGHYKVKVTNGFGTTTSKEGTLAIVGINLYPVVTISGKVGDTYRVDYATALAPTTWIPFSTNKLTSPTQLILDSSSPGNNSRFYQAVFLF